MVACDSDVSSFSYGASMEDRRILKHVYDNVHRNIYLDPSKTLTVCTRSGAPISFRRMGACDSDVSSFSYGASMEDRRILKHVYDNVHGNIYLDPGSELGIDHFDVQTVKLAGPYMDNRMQTVQRALGVRSYPQMRASVAELDENHEMDGNILLHSMEEEAYTAVLRAFSAQSDAISWSKEGIITELRRELTVSDLEHGQLLVEINADEFVRKLREWMKNAALSQEMLCSRMDTPSSVVQSISQSNKILKQSCNDVSTFRRYVSPNQQTSATNVSSFPEVQALFDARLHLPVTCASISLFSLVVDCVNWLKKGTEIAKPCSNRKIKLSDAVDILNQSRNIQLSVKPVITELVQAIEEHRSWTGKGSMQEKHASSGSDDSDADSDDSDADSDDSDDDSDDSDDDSDDSDDDSDDSDDDSDDSDDDSDDSDDDSDDSESDHDDYLDWLIERIEWDRGDDYGLVQILTRIEDNGLDEQGTRRVRRARVAEAFQTLFGLHREGLHELHYYDRREVERRVQLFYELQDGCYLQHRQCNNPDCFFCRSNKRHHTWMAYMIGLRGGGEDPEVDRKLLSKPRSNDSARVEVRTRIWDVVLAERNYSTDDMFLI